MSNIKDLSNLKLRIDKSGICRAKICHYMKNHIILQVKVCKGAVLPVFLYIETNQEKVFKPSESMDLKILSVTAQNAFFE